MDTIRVTADAETLLSRAAELVDAGRIAVARPLLAAARALGPASPELALIGCPHRIVQRGVGTGDAGT